MSTPEDLVGSYSFRCATTDDFEDITRLRREAFANDKIPEVPTLAEVAEELDGTVTVLADDTLLALVSDPDAGSDRTVGLAYTVHLPSEQRLERCILVMTVDAAHRDGPLGDTLTRWGVDRARTQLLSSDRSLPCYIRTYEYDFVTYYHRLWARAGFEPVRYDEQLIRALGDVPEPTAPEGYTIVAWDHARSEEIRLVSNAAFADHWGSTPYPREVWAQHIEATHSRLDCSFIALDHQGAVAAYLHSARYEADDELCGRREAWIEKLGTLREHRGRGIASALIDHALAAYAADGLSHARIGVDSANPSGAAELYRRLGFEPSTQTIISQIQVR